MLSKILVLSNLLSVFAQSACENKDGTTATTAECTCFESTTCKAKEFCHEVDKKCYAACVDGEEITGNVCWCNKASCAVGNVCAMSRGLTDATKDYCVTAAPIVCDLDKAVAADTVCGCAKEYAIGVEHCVAKETCTKTTADGEETYKCNKGAADDAAGYASFLGALAALTMTMLNL